MRYNKKNLEDLESSINALHKKASNINDVIKKHDTFSDKIEKVAKNKPNSIESDSLIINEKSWENTVKKKSDIEILENKLKEELLNLKRKQKVLVIMFYVIIMLFISSIILALELNLI